MNRIMRKRILTAVTVLVLLMGGIVTFYLCTGRELPIGFGPSAGLVVDVAYFRKLSEYDPGTVNLCVRNNSRRPILVRNVILNGFPISVAGVPKAMVAEQHADEDSPGIVGDISDVSSKRVLWARIRPNPIPAGKSANLAARLSTATANLLNVAIETKTGTVEHTVPPIPVPLRMSAVGFSEKLDSVYVHVANDGERPILLKSIDMPGIELDGPPLILSRKLQPGGRSLCVLKPVVRLMIGSHVVVDLCGVVERRGAQEHEVRITGQARAFSFFPFGSEGALEAKNLVTAANFPSDIDPSAPSDPSTPGDDETIVVEHDSLALECPMHAHGGNRWKCASAILERVAQLANQEPESPAAIHLCRTKPVSGSYLFGGTADIIRVNTTVRPGSYALADAGKEHFSQWLCRMMQMAAAPGVVHAVIPGKEDGVRRYVYYSLSRGAKGVLFRSQPPIDEPRALKREMKVIAPLLSTADWYGSTYHDSLELATLVSSPQTVVIIAIRHKEMRGVPSSEKSGSDANDSPPMEIMLPGWFTAVDARLVFPDGGEPVEIIVSGGKTTLRMPRISVARAVIVSGRGGQ